MSMREIKFLLPLVAAAVALGAAPTVWAHGFGDRYDLPVPLSYFVVGGGAAVVLSFAIIGIVVEAEKGALVYPRFNLFQISGARFLLGQATAWILRLAGLSLFFLVLVAGFYGDSDPVSNLAPTFIWVIWWVGMGFFIALFGNLWALVNPWKILYGWAESAHQLVWSGKQLGLGVKYPESAGIWPSVILFFCFAWLESAFSGSSDPRNLVLLAVIYSLITLTGMFIFGKHEWLRHGEAFSVVFGFLARFSVTEMRIKGTTSCVACGDSCAGEDGDCVNCSQCLETAIDSEFNLRPPAVGLNNIGKVGVDVLAMVILLLATVTFDGFSATPEWQEIQTFFFWLMPRGTVDGITVAATLGLIGVPLGFAMVYISFAYLMHRAVRRETPTIDMAKGFVFSLVPIALAYNFAHFLSFLLIQGQLLIPLASDPLGIGWDLFGTVGYTINIRITNARFIWFFSVGVIVLGHIIAVYLAHIRAIAMYGNRDLVLRSQLPMLGLMVVYTITSLWIVSRPIVE